MGTEEPQQPGSHPPPPPSKTGYGARWKRWLLIYLVVGVIAYVIIYFAFLRDGFSY